jgi:ketosteroid isomerase-like protein
VTHDALIQRFYAAFADRDGAAMAACYAPDARFSDPVFPGLAGDEVGAMWRMLTSSSDDLRVELLDHTATGDDGSARWRAHYTFTQTGRPVVNEVTSAFRFREGLIAEQTDSFPFHRWARQALGVPGALLGWTPFMRAAVQRSAAGSLERFRGRE